MAKFFLLLLLPLATLAQNRYDLVPQPSKLIPHEGRFRFSKQTRLVVPLADKGLMPVVEAFAAQLRAVTGLPLEYFSANSVNIPPGAHVFFIEAPAGKVGPEGYRLSVEPDRIGLVAATPKGYFYATQTLLQLLPTEVFSPQPQPRTDWVAPCLELEDAPRFAYRGLMLDVSRHFFPVAFVKKYIDLLALHKLNTFHWHLTDDQGWRIEIKKYPRLTEVGSRRRETVLGHAAPGNPAYTGRYDGKPYGGFYTQDEIREVVAYAERKFVTVIPEIELPGHALAALAAYPELGCNPDKIYQVGTIWGVHDDIFCPREATFEFLENVLTEVMTLFPSQYIHIGGDEAPKTVWRESRFCQQLMQKEGLKDEHELQSYFIRRIEKFLNGKGRKLLGWDEILEGGLAPQATVMSWRGTEGGIAAARQGHDAIMTPSSHVYLDYYQAEPLGEPFAIGGYLPLEKVYGYEPVPAELSPNDGKRIIGTQANLWTEYTATPEAVEYMVFPRACALAEVAWAARGQRDYADFVKRLGTHLQRLDRLGVHYARRLYDVTLSTQPTPGQPLKIVLTSAAEGPINYTLDGSDPTPKSPVYAGPVSLTKSLTLKALNFPGGQPGKAIARTFSVNKATGKSYTLSYPPNPQYLGNDAAALTNGVAGLPGRWDTWVGFKGYDLSATLDLGAVTDVKRVTTHFLQAPSSLIYHPASVEISVSTDGKNFSKTQTIAFDPASRQPIETATATPAARARYVRVLARNALRIAPGKPGEGQPAWLFCDEIGVE